MARSASIAVENNLTKGLITEATGLNFPENACTETFNCVFERTGEVTRRRGFEMESSLTPVDFTDAAVAEFVWNSVSKDGEQTFVVLQVGDIIYFYAVETDSISENLKNFRVNLSNLKVTGALNTHKRACSFASGNGLLFVAHPFCDPFYVEYDSDTDDITVTSIEIKIRDMHGILNEDNTGRILDFDERPTPDNISNEIMYNLLNQGWYASHPATFQNIHYSQHFVLDYFVNFMALYPSESEIWWQYNAPLHPELDEDGNVVEGKPDDAFSYLQFSTQRNLFGNTPAPKGHYIMSAFDQDRSAVSEADAIAIREYTGGFGTPVDTSGIEAESAGFHRPSQIAFFAGRVFYAGVNAGGFNTRLYFTQILDKNKQLDRCYQKQDPTAEEASDLLASDGGVIEIPDIAKVVKLFVAGSSLYVFASNGVWRVTGSEGIGFTATDIAIHKISDTPASSASSFVNVEGVPIWWNTDGIWTFQQDNAISVPKVVSITQKTIQSFYDEIPSASKRFAKAAYNPLTGVVQWLYRSTEVASDNVQSNFRYDRILNFDVSTGAFYPWTIPTTDNKVEGILVLQGVSAGTSSTTVTVDNVAVTVDSDEVTVDGELVAVPVDTNFKYVVIRLFGAVGRKTFAHISNDSYVDWEGHNLLESSYTSYFVTGFKVRGEGIRKFQSNYIKIFARTDVASEFDFYTQWDYSGASQDGRWTQKQRLTFTALPDFSFKSRRLKVRGHGHALAFRFTSVDDKPFHIIGWTTFDSGNNSP